MVFFIQSYFTYNPSASNRHGEYDEREYAVPFQRSLDTFLFANAFHFQHIYCCNIWTKKMFSKQ